MSVIIIFIVLLIGLNKLTGIHMKSEFIYEEIQKELKIIK